MWFPVRERPSCSWALVEEVAGLVVLQRLEVRRSGSPSRNPPINLVHHVGGCRVLQLFRCSLCGRGDLQEAEEELADLKPAVVRSVRPVLLPSAGRPSATFSVKLPWREVGGGVVVVSFFFNNGSSCCLWIWRADVVHFLLAGRGGEEGGGDGAQLPRSEDGVWSFFGLVSSCGTGRLLLNLSGELLRKEIAEVVFGDCSFHKCVCCDLGTCGRGGCPLLRRWHGASDEMEGLLRLSTDPGGRKVVRRARSSFSASPAGRGGEGRSGWMGVFRFWLVLLVVLFSSVSAPAGHGGEGSVVCWRSGGAVGGPGRRCVGGKMGGAGEQVLWPCPFIEPDSVARRRMDHAVVYNMWWRLLPGDKWYGDADNG